MIKKLTYKMKPPVSAKPRKSILKKLGVGGLYVMNENGGDVAFDSSGNNHNIQLTNVSWVDGKYGKALEANAAGEYGTIDNTSGFISSQAGTIIMYFKSNVIWADNQMHFLFGGWGGANDAGDFYCAKWPTNWLFVVFDDGAATRYISIAVPFPTWQTGTHIVITWDRSRFVVPGSYIGFYVNGLPYPLSAACGVAWNPYAIDNSLGLLNDIEATGFHADGVLDYFCCCNRSLLPSEISKLWARFFYMFDRPAQNYFHVAAAPPPATSLFMDLGTLYWTVKKANGLYTRL